MKIVRRITHISLGIMKFLIFVALSGFFRWIDILYYSFGIKGIFFSIGICIVCVFHFFFVFPKKLKHIFPPILFEDEIAEIKQKHATHTKQINSDMQKLIDDCYWGEIEKEEISKRLDSIMQEKEALKNCEDKYPIPSKKFTLHSPQSYFQEQNPILYTILILSAMLFACILFFSSYFWLILHSDSPSESYQSNGYEYEIEPKLWVDMEDTVYISSTGKIHLRSDCSGMKSYDEMTYEEACEAGYEHCSRCFN